MDHDHDAEAGAAAEAEQLLQGEEEELLALAAADSQAPPSQSVLPGSTAPGGRGAPASAAAAAAAADREQEELLALLEGSEGDGTELAGASQGPQQQQQPGSQAEAALEQPSLQFGSFPPASLDVADGRGAPNGAAEEAAGSEPPAGSEALWDTQMEAAAVEPSPVLGLGTEAGGGEEQEEGGHPAFVPETELPDPTQEL